MITDVEMAKLKDTQLEIMDFIHRICVDNGIQYFLHAGSCIGAVRHDGYIPWDYDIDICMLRDDYDKFETIMSESSNPLYIYKNFRCDRDYYRPHAIVVKNNTLLLTKYEAINRKMKNHHGIYVDVMPLDFCDGGKHDAKTVKRLKRIKRIISAKRGFHFSVNESVFKRASRGFVRNVLRILPLRVLNSYRELLMRSNAQYGTKFVTEYTTKYAHEKALWPADVFSSVVLHRFEDREYFIPEEYDRFLSTMYGDYMKIPDASTIMDQRDVFAEVDFGEDG